MEKMPIYGEDGRVGDEKIAEKMAHVEDKGHKKFLGIFPARKSNIEKSQREAEQAGEKYYKEKGVEIAEENIPSDVLAAINTFVEELGENERKAESKIELDKWQLANPGKEVEYPYNGPMPVRSINYRRNGAIRAVDNGNGEIEYLIPCHDVVNWRGNTNLFNSFNRTFGRNHEGTHLFPAMVTCKTKSGKILEISKINNRIR